MPRMALTIPMETRKLKDPLEGTRGDSKGQLGTAPPMSALGGLTEFPLWRRYAKMLAELMFQMVIL
jgi:hypothetical protein